MSARARATPATRLPVDFAVTAEMRAWAAARAPAVDLDLAHEAFCAYWWGCGKTKQDWAATWRHWMLRDQQRANERPAPRASPHGNGHRGGVGWVKPPRHLEPGTEEYTARSKGKYIE